MDREARHGLAQRPAITSMFKCRQASGRGVHQAVLSLLTSEAKRNPSPQQASDNREAVAAKSGGGEHASRKSASQIRHKCPKAGRRCIVGSRPS